MIVTVLLYVTECAIRCVRNLKRRIFMSATIITLGCISACFWISAIFNPEFLCYLLKLLLG